MGSHASTRAEQHLGFKSRRGCPGGEAQTLDLLGWKRFGTAVAARAFERVRGGDGVSKPKADKWQAAQEQAEGAGEVDRMIWSAPPTAVGWTGCWTEVRGGQRWTVLRQ